MVPVLSGEPGGPAEPRSPTHPFRIPQSCNPCSFRKNITMFARGVLIAVLSSLLSQPAAAEPRSESGCRPKHEPIREAEVCRPPLPFRGAEHSSAATLRQIAIYVSIGNRDGVEILTAQLRATGISAADVKAAITWLKLPDGPPQGISGKSSASAGLAQF